MTLTIWEELNSGEIYEPTIGNIKQALRSRYLKPTPRFLRVCLIKIGGLFLGTEKAHFAKRIESITKILIGLIHV